MGIATGILKDSVTGSGVEGLTLNVCRGIYTKTGTLTEQTTTIYNPIEGQYLFYVYNWSGIPDIKSSGATVKVYNGNNNEPAYVFSVPFTDRGRY